MKKVLILGVNGFIGHHLSQRILATTDWEVYGMDINSERVADLMPDPRFHFFEGDILISKEWIEYHVRKCDVILPLVAIATPATYVTEPLRVFELDFEANLPIIRHAVRYKKRVVFPSTSEVYGMSQDRDSDHYQTLRNIARFSRRDADAYDDYARSMYFMAKAVKYILGCLLYTSDAADE